MDEKKHFLVDLAETIVQHLPQQAERDNESTPKPSWTRWLGRHFVPNVGTLLLVVVLIVTQQVWAGPLLGTTNVPGPSATTINYQGRLADNSGTPLDGTYGMSFALYDAPTDGNLVWGPETHGAVPVSDGLFSVGLGSQTSGGIPTSVWNGDVYLEVTVDGETLEPRELIRSVPIAGMALTVPDAAITSEKMAPTIFSSYIGEEISIGDDSNPTEVLLLNVDFPDDATYLIFVRALTTNDFNNRVILSLQDEDGITIQGSVIHTPHTEAGNQGSHSSSVVLTHSFSAGQHSIRLMAGGEGSPGSGTVRSGHIIAIPFHNY